MRASALALRAAVIFAIAGMAIGIHMAASHQHGIAPAHAHINLVGWVSLFLIGLFYRAHPALDVGRAALAQVWIWIAGTVVMGVSLVLLLLGNEAIEPLAAISSVVVFADMLWFALVVFRNAG